MLLEYIKRHVDLNALKEELRKVGNNLVTAGIVGVFINHYVGSNLSTMFWSSVSITAIGMLALYFGVRRREKYD
ncbi:MAG: hypothetical protein WBE18_01950 [Gammaproteobacteria bacterium]